MRYVVTAVPWDSLRVANVAVMREQIPHLEVVMDTCRDAYLTFFDACRRINETGGIILEDDVQLCRDFTRRAEEIVATYGGGTEVVHFFDRPKVALETAFVGGSSFAWNQCTYFPPGLPIKFQSYHDRFKAERPKQWQGMAKDRLVAYTLVKEKRKFWRVRPTLVQHLPLPSVIGSRPANRQTPYFIDDVEANQ